MSIKDPAGSDHPFRESETVIQQTAVKGAGSYRLLFSNVDSELRLWVNNRFVEFDKTTAYAREKRQPLKDFGLRPFYGGPDNPGDLAPAGVGGKNLKARIKRLRIHRDKYYVAVKGPGFGPGHDPTSGDYKGGVRTEDVRRLFRSPEEWAITDLFDKDEIQMAEFVLKDFDDDSKDQFFPMGDNSPQSHDARVWNGTANYVERQFLIGEAVLIYYPHAWHAKLPGKNFKTIPLLFYPKFSRMGIIR
jgi:signal peptidase I